MMNCARCRELLVDLLYGELDAAVAAEVALHLAGCAECRAEEQRLAGTRATFAPLFAEAGPLEEPGPAFDGPILAAAREAAEAAAAKSAARAPLAPSGAAVIALAGRSASPAERRPAARPRWMRGALVGSIAAAAALALVVSIGRGPDRFDARPRSAEESVKSPARQLAPPPPQAPAALGLNGPPAPPAGAPIATPIPAEAPPAPSQPALPPSSGQPVDAPSAADKTSAAPTTRSRRRRRSGTPRRSATPGSPGKENPRAPLAGRPRASPRRRATARSAACRGSAVPLRAGPPRVADKARVERRRGSRASSAEQERARPSGPHRKRQPRLSRLTPLRPLGAKMPRRSSRRLRPPRLHKPIQSKARRSRKSSRSHPPRLRASPCSRAPRVHGSPRSQPPRSRRRSMPKSTPRSTPLPSPSPRPTLPRRRRPPSRARASRRPHPPRRLEAQASAARRSGRLEQAARLAASAAQERIRTGDPSRSNRPRAIWSTPSPATPSSGASPMRARCANSSPRSLPPRTPRSPTPTPPSPRSPRPPPAQRSPRPRAPLQP